MRAARLGLRVAAMVIVALGLAELGVRFGEPRELAAERRRTETLRTHVNLGAVLQSIDRYPTNVPGSTQWTTFGQLSIMVPAARPGATQVVYFGAGDGALVAKLADRLGRDRVELIDARTETATTASTLLLASRLSTAPVIVADHGFTDLLYYRARARGAWDFFRGDASPNAPAFGVTRRGLLGWFARPRDEDLPRWFAEAPFQEPMSNLWQLSRNAWLSGQTLIVVAPVAPEGDDARNEREIRALWPVLGSLARYRRELGEFRTRLASFAATAGVALVDPALQASSFASLSTLTDAGIEAKIAAIAAAIAPLLARPLAPRAIAAAKPLVDPAMITTHPRDGICVRGPCPEHACFVPAGRATFGFAEPVLKAHIEKVKTGVGIGDMSWDEDDGPPISVELSAFCIDRTEASEADRARCVAEGNCPAFADPPHTDGKSWPAVMPSAVDAEAFCAWRGGRLPTDAEWEAAARGADERLYPWGNAWSGKEANFCGAECRFGIAGDPNDGALGVAPIGSFSGVSPYGLVDLGGNLWEWTADCFASGAHRLIPAGARDPIVGGDRGCRRFLRGGSFQSYPGFLEKRNAEGLTDVDVPTRGVRCVYDFGTRHTRFEDR